MPAFLQTLRGSTCSPPPPRLVLPPPPAHYHLLLMHETFRRKQCPHPSLVFRQGCEEARARQRRQGFGCPRRHAHARPEEGASARRCRVHGRQGEILLLRPPSSAPLPLFLLRLQLHRRQLMQSASAARWARLMLDANVLLVHPKCEHAHAASYAPASPQLQNSHIYPPTEGIAYTCLHPCSVLPPRFTAVVRRLVWSLPRCDCCGYRPRGGRG